MIPTTTSFSLLFVAETMDLGIRGWMDAIRLAASFVAVGETAILVAHCGMDEAGGIDDIGAGRGNAVVFEISRRWQGAWNGICWTWRRRTHISEGARLSLARFVDLAGDMAATA